MGQGVMQEVGHLLVRTATDHVPEKDTSASATVVKHQGEHCIKLGFAPSCVASNAADLGLFCN